MIENEIDSYSKKCLVTVLFDALMVEKIYTYSLGFDNSIMLADDLHKEYLKEAVY